MNQPESSPGSCGDESVENPNLRWVSLIPLFCLIVAIIAAIKMFPVGSNLSEADLEWGGLHLASPIPSAKRYTTANDGILFETSKPATVRAATDGSVALTAEGALHIDSGTTTVAYEGLKTINVKNGQSVKRGDPIGSVEGDSTAKSGLLLRVFQHGECLKPTAALNLPKPSH